METLTRHSWIHYTVCWIVKLVHGNIDQTLVNSLHGLLNCEIGGLMCHVITTEYRTCVHCIHVMYHLFCDALVNVIYFVVSGQYSYSILLYNWVLFLRLFFFSFQKTFIYFTTITQQVIQSCSLAPILHSGGLLFLLQTNHRTWTSST